MSMFAPVPFNSVTHMCIMLFVVMFAPFLFITNLHHCLTSNKLLACAIVLSEIETNASTSHHPSSIKLLSPPSTNITACPTSSTKQMYVHYLRLVNKTNNRYEKRVVNFPFSINQPTFSYLGFYAVFCSFHIALDKFKKSSAFKVYQLHAYFLCSIHFRRRKLFHTFITLLRKNRG